VGDFIRYFLLLFVPFFLIGAIYGFIYRCYLMCFLVNPVVYAGGIALIVVLIRHDVNDILALIGHAREHQLSLHIKHGSTIQQISLLMSASDYASALKTVNRLLRDEPDYPNALNLKGQILLEGFGEPAKARLCFDRVMVLAPPDSEEYRLAESLKMASHNVEDEGNP
jgi:hypothetical protein